MRATKSYRMAMTEQAKKLVSQMTLAQKVSLMSGNIDMLHMTPETKAAMMEAMADEKNHYNVVPYEAGGIPEMELPSMKFVDGPRGVVCGNGQATCFPVSMARGATFDTALEEKVGHCIGRETRAFGGNLFAGVCINMPYNPGWGRSQETYGEETCQIGQMGAALVRGVQGEDVMACVKHFAYNDMECARFKCSVTCDQRTEKEVFLPHFKDCVDAGAASIMSAYNRYNGVHCGHSNYLLNEVLKKEWDFDGFVMSDFCWGVRDTVEAANGGQDMEMMWTQFFGENLVKAVQDGFVPEEKINQAATRIVRTILAFDKGHKEYDMSVVGCKEHIAVAKEVAEKAITLIKNDGVLPLNKAATKKLALIGKLGDTQNIGDHGSSWVRPAYVVTPKEGLEKSNPGCEITYCDGTDIEAAKKAAASADAVVFVVGYNHDDEGEFISENETENYIGSMGGDRKTSLGLHPDEIRLIQAVAPENKNSCVVLIGGNMIMMTEWYDVVGSVLMAYYPGMEGGTAIAEILYGDVNPSGKLPYVVPVSEADLPYVNWEATDQYYEYYHGYTRLEKNGVKPLVPYGYGLSYTTFAVTEPTASANADTLTVTAKVKNTGSVAGDEVVQFYAGYENSAIDRPVKQLRGFARVSLAPGEEKTVTITTPLEKLKYYDPTHREWKLEQMAYTCYVGTSAANEDLVTTQVTL
ncbi:MAG: glycoside hydrolase family 3 C-terminal domain-containing protein [Pygmaiobacter sp.]|nr:glycoside hydrolase family 3 C-terminal domain-containing protein [Pygmaiobacter sp.]